MKQQAHYDFRVQKAAGEQGEKLLDAFFERAYEITPATAAEQRQGIDRHFVNRATGAKLTVEYKSDSAAKRTHNAFVETVSVSARGKSGWAYTSQADWLAYYVPGDELVYLIRFERLRARLTTWAARYPVRHALNDSYKTYGLIVPLEEFERCADCVWSL
ncbi:MAG: hypothetical protein U0521_28560 [Anaerolineae bacterium]